MKISTVFMIRQERQNIFLRNSTEFFFEWVKNYFLYKTFYNKLSKAHFNLQAIANDFSENCIVLKLTFLPAKIKKNLEMLSNKGFAVPTSVYD